MIVKEPVYSNGCCAGLIETRFEGARSFRCGLASNALFSHRWAVITPMEPSCERYIQGMSHLNIPMSLNGSL